MAMDEPIDGNAIGDAVFDAMQNVKVVPEVVGDTRAGRKVALGFGSGNFCILLDTGGSSYSGDTVVNECYVEDEE